MLQLNKFLLTEKNVSLYQYIALNEIESKYCFDLRFSGPVLFMLFSILSPGKIRNKFKLSVAASKTDFYIILHEKKICVFCVLFEYLLQFIEVSKALFRLRPCIPVITQSLNIFRLKDSVFYIRIQINQSLYSGARVRLYAQ